MTSIYLSCPQCGDEAMEIEIEYESPDPEVGIMFGGYVVTQHIPKRCPQPECGYVFTPTEHAALEAEAKERADCKDSDLADQWADRHADAYFTDRDNRYT